MQDYTVNVLGTDYKVKFCFIDENCDGDCGFYDKTIRIRPENKMLDAEQSTDEEKHNRQKEVIRHELAHAFLFESGETEWARDERLVEWIAVQSPKLFTVFKEHGLL